VADPDGEIVESYTTSWGRSRLDELPAFYPFEVGAKDAKRPMFPRYAAKSPDPADYLYRRVLKQLGIEAPADVDPLVGHYPRAPDFTLTDTTGKVHRLGEYAGRLLVLVFIARDCPRCKELLIFLGNVYGELGPASRKERPWLDVLIVSNDVSGEALKKLVAQRNYKFPVAPDPDWKARTAFRYRGAVPDVFFIGPEGRIRFRHKGFTLRHPGVLDMEIRTLLGLETKPLLLPAAFTGDEACRICHAKEHADWGLTRHACAWESLVRLGKEKDPKCIVCHAVGYRERGGFLSATSTPHLTDVQCESCHGQNGCAAFRSGHKAAPIKAQVCQRCHDRVHSPRFDFAAYRPRVLHDRHAELAKLPRAEREARLRRLCGGSRDQLFDPDTPYVGSAACGRCHPTEHKALEDGFHARALEALAKPAPDHWSVPRQKRGVVGLRRAECVRCHVTGYGRPGGFPSTSPASPRKHALAGVGCEACHGPGRAHADDPKKPKAILRFGGTCPECNVLPICRRCHDDANSPAFDYREALPKAKHPVGQPVTP
jgi:peroxiredoxin